MVFYAPAKVNLYLELLARLSSGYHSLDTVMAAVSWYDTLSFSPPTSSPTALELTIVDHGARASVREALPTDQSNLVMKALLALKQRAGLEAGAHVTLVKRIASQAGLGGGSSDAATALIGANHFWQLGYSLSQLHEIAANLGSDVAFFLTGGIARCRGRGELVEPLPVHAPLNLVIVKPPVGLSTAEVYRRCLVDEHPGSADAMCNALMNADARKVGQSLFNRLEPPACELTPWIENLGSRFAQTGSLGWQLSGSGSACFGIYGNWLQARRAAQIMKREMSLDVQVVKTVQRGCNAITA